MIGQKELASDCFLKQNQQFVQLYHGGENKLISNDDEISLAQDQHA
jgi:hypothetical protein